MNATTPQLERAMSPPASTTSVPTRTRLMHRGLRLVLLGSALVVGVIATPATAAPKSQSARPSSTATPEKKMLEPTSDAAEVLTRLLALIDSLHEPRDLTPEQVKQFIGIELNAIPHRPSSAVASHPLNTTFFYHLRAFPDLESRLPSLKFRFEVMPEFRDQSPVKTDICAFDMDRFHAALLTMGYAHTGSNRAGTLARQYKRGNVDMNVAHVGESREKIHHDCVYSVDAYFVNRSLSQEEGK